MRKQGIRIKDKRLKFKRGLQKQFIGKLKNRSKMNWRNLANLLDVSRHTLRVDWYEEKSTMPYQIVKKILKRYPFESFEGIKINRIEKVLGENWGQKLVGSRNLKKIKIPKKDEKLAEILGIILGDGHLEKKELTITGNIQEKIHYNYINKLIKDLFNLDCKIFQSKSNPNSIILDAYSTELIKHLISNGMVLGNKIKNKASLPKWIFKKREFIYGALRGLFDTDGGIYHKQKKYKRAVIEFQTKSPYIRENIFLLLKKGGFIPSKSTGNIRIQNQEEIHKFFKLVGSSNPKNIIRYNHFIKERHIPLKEHLVRETKNFKGRVPFKCAFS